MKSDKYWKTRTILEGDNYIVDGANWIFYKPGGGRAHQSGGELLENGEVKPFTTECRAKYLEYALNLINYCDGKGISLDFSVAEKEEPELRKHKKLLEDLLERLGAST